MGKSESRRLPSGKLIKGAPAQQRGRRPTELVRLENLLALGRRGWLVTRGQQ